mgnify:CR=1 FL=1
MALITFAVIKGPVKIIIAHIQLKNRTKLQSTKINFKYVSARYFKIMPGSGSADPACQDPDPDPCFKILRIRIRIREIEKCGSVASLVPSTYVICCYITC